MEVFLLVIVFAAYIAIRVALGAANDTLTKDKKKYARGIALAKCKDWAGAKEYFDKVLEKEPRSATALLYRGKANAALEEPYNALADFTRATAIDYRIGEAYLDKGIILWDLGEIDNAFIEIDKACWHMRNHAPAFRLRGKLYIKLGHEQKALADFRQAVVLGDEDANYMLNKLRHLEKGSGTQ